MSGKERDNDDDTKRIDAATALDVEGVQPYYYEGFDPNDNKPPGVATIKTLHTEDYELPDVHNLTRQFDKKDGMYPEHDVTIFTILIQTLEYIILLNFNIFIFFFFSFFYW